MTRFARASGSKANNSKTPDDSTPWSELKPNPERDKRRSESNPGSSLDRKSKATFKTNAKELKWASFSDTSKLNSSKTQNSGQESINSHEDSGDSKNILKNYFLLDDNKLFGRYITGPSKLKLQKLRDELIAKNTDPDEIMKIINLEKKKIQQDFKKNSCFHCQGNHLLKDCPVAKEKGTTICYSCGSTEHTVFKCKSKKKGGNKFAFATCFICKEQGHISTECPDNPCGLYPYGGSCKECGEVTHFANNCPKKLAKVEKNKFHANVINFRNVEGLDDEPIAVTVPKPKKKCKIVKF